jgi:hypothetical protein
MPLSGIFSHFGLSKKKNSAFLDSPVGVRSNAIKVILDGVLEEGDFLLHE